MYLVQTNFEKFIADVSDPAVMRKLSNEYTSKMLSKGYLLCDVKFVYGEIHVRNASSIRSFIRKLGV